MIVDYDFPPINTEPNPFLKYWAAQLFIGHFSDNPDVITLTQAYIRQVASACEFYAEAKSSFQQYFKPSSDIKISSLHRATAHLEACVTNAHRAAHCFKILRGRQELPEAARVALNSVKPKFIAGGVSNRLCEFRNAIHHMEDRLARGDIDHEELNFASIEGDEFPFEDGINKNQTKKIYDRSVIAGQEIFFRELAEWLNEMIAFAERIANLMPTSGRPPAAPQPAQ